MTPHVQLKEQLIGWESRRIGARSWRLEGNVEAERNYTPRLPRACDEEKTSEVGLGPQLPLGPALSALSFQKAEEKGQDEWRLLSALFSKGGKGELHLPASRARLRLRSGICRHLAPSEAPQTNLIPGVP